MPNFYTNVKTRLNKQGFSTTKAEILEIAEHLGIEDIENATSEEILTGLEYFISNYSSISLIVEPEEEGENSFLPQLPTPKETPCHHSSTPSSVPQPEPEETAIALQEKSELVASTANDMGITLSIEEVTAIAENFDYASVNSDYEIAEIESAITAFVQHKAQVTKQKITNMVQGVRETVTRLDHENSQLLNDGLREINNDIKSGSQRFKSQVRTALKAFALPPSKTG